MQPSPSARQEYVAAFGQLIERIAKKLTNVPKSELPVRLYVAGGAAMHFYTGERVSLDIDGTFSRRLALPDNLEVGYRDVDGAATVLYFDRQYSDTLALLHEDAYQDSERLELPGVDDSVLEVRLLNPVDLAVSKIARFGSQDRDDVAALARRGLVSASAIRKRAEEALANFVGDTVRVQGSIEAACRIAKDAAQRP